MTSPCAKRPLALLKTAVRHPDRNLRRAMGQRCLGIVDTIDLATAGDGMAFAQEILGKLVEDDEVTLVELVRRARTWSPANQVVLVQVVLRHDLDGSSSSLLDEILAWQPADEVKRIIWKSRS